MNRGRITIAEGLMRFGNFTQSDGAVRLMGGSLQAFQPFVIAGGSLEGSGLFTGRVENIGGRVEPGIDEPGTLEIRGGDYVQSSGGTLIVDLGGLDPGVEHDVLDVSESSVVLDGLLRVKLVEDFIPVVGNQFDIVLFQSVEGAFESVVAPAGVQLDVSYTDGSITIEVVAVAQPGDQDFDGDIDLEDFARFGVCFGSREYDCAQADVNGDEVVDSADAIAFLEGLTGP